MPFNSPAAAHLKKDLMKNKYPDSNIEALPLPSNIQEWPWQDPDDFPYEGGMYHGMLECPPSLLLKQKSEDEKVQWIVKTQFAASRLDTNLKNQILFEQFPALFKEINEKKQDEAAKVGTTYIEYIMISQEGQGLRERKAREKLEEAAKEGMTSFDNTLIRQEGQELRKMNKKKTGSRRRCNIL